MLDEKRDLFLFLPNDHPVALDIPLHTDNFVMLYVLQLLRESCGSMEAWADDIERTIRDAARQMRRMLQNRSHP